MILQRANSKEGNVFCRLVLIFVSFPSKERKYWLIYKRQLFAAGKSVLRSMAAHIPRKLERPGVVPGVSKSKFLKSSSSHRVSGVGGDGSDSGGRCRARNGRGAVGEAASHFMAEIAPHLWGGF